MEEMRAPLDVCSVSPDGGPLSHIPGIFRAVASTRERYRSVSS
jgi:hypothetical protein